MCDLGGGVAGEHMMCVGEEMCCAVVWWLYLGGAQHCPLQSIHDFLYSIIIIITIIIIMFVTRTHAPTHPTPTHMHARTHRPHTQVVSQFGGN